MQRQTRQDRFNSAFPTWAITATEGSNKIPCRCLECGEEATFTAQTLNRLARICKEPECKSIECSPPLPKGQWNLFETDRVNKRLLLECESCYTKYWHHKLDTDYLVCFCKLKTKKLEMAIYKELFENDHLTVLREAYFDKTISSHKCDMLILCGRSEIFVEVDGPEHYSTAKMNEDEAFHKLFKEKRKSNQHLVRIPDDLKQSDFEIFAKTIKDECLDPVSRLFETDVDEDWGPECRYEEL